MKSILWAALSALVSVGCSDRDTTEATRTDTQSTALAPTYYEDVAPIFSAKCVACHQAGGIAPFALDDYQAARDRGALIADYTRERIMPPYAIDTSGECGSFDETVTLTDEEIAVIGEWGRGERAQGTPGAVRVPPLPELDGGTDFELPAFVPVIDGSELAKFDEYRCFPFEPHQTTNFITGYDVRPGNSRLVHHVLGFIVDPSQMTADGRTNAEIMQQLRASEPDPARAGWPCFGMAGEGLEVQSVPVTWGPGQGVFSYPGSIGVPFTQGSQLVVQVHYNMADEGAEGQADQTTVRLRLVPEVDRQAAFALIDPLLESVFTPTPTLLEPGKASVEYLWDRSGADIGFPAGVSAELMSLGPHMHGRGRKFRFEVDAGSGFACQGRIDRWDFNWQRFYDYETPLPFTAATRLRVSCDYDTSGDVQPVMPGWGTRNEMCLATIMLALPPGL